MSKFATLVLLIAACVVTSEPRATAVVADISVFYDRLEPHGLWVEVSDHGWCWAPGGVPAAWRPYTHGHWIYTEYGWTWTSDWAWGWAPFHYGRWLVTPRHGWVWMPGITWAPAWVAWRHGDGWIGWAPLPPQVVWRAGLVTSNVRWDVVVAPSHWSYVRERDFNDRRVRSRVVARERNLELIRRTRNVTRYSAVGTRAAHRSIGAEDVERATSRRVTRYRTEDAHSPRNRIDGRRMETYRPPIRSAKPSRSPRPRSR